MGWGDEVIGSGDAKRVHRETGQRVEILDRNGARREHPVWSGNQKIARIGEAGRFFPVINGPGARPYINQPCSNRLRWVWCDYQCEPGEIPGLSWRPLRSDKPRVLIEPWIKAGASPNKQWHGWFRLVEIMRDIQFVQVGPPGTRFMRCVDRIQTSDFRQGCAVMATCDAAVLPEGGLHHAAAAIGVPAIVIFGGYIAPRNTGYQSHRNLFTGGEACGSRRRCQHCAHAMSEITPEMVGGELRKLLDGRWQKAS